MAQTNEATAKALRSNLEIVLAQVNNNNNADGIHFGEDDAESCCRSSGDATEEYCDKEEGEQVIRWRKVARTSAVSERKAVSVAVEEEEEEEGKKRMYRRCRGVESSVLVLPCRHLCLCSICGPSMDTCPNYNSTKNASVHVNFS